MKTQKHQLTTEFTLFLNLVHCDSIIMRSSGSTVKNPRYNGPHYLHATVVQILIKIVNAASLPGFHMPDA